MNAESFQKIVMIPLGGHAASMLKSDRNKLAQAIAKIRADDQSSLQIVFRFFMSLLHDLIIRLIRFTRNSTWIRIRNKYLSYIMDG